MKLCRLGEFGKEKAVIIDKDNNPKWPELPNWYSKPSDLKNLFISMCENNISEKVATKIVGENWLSFMKNQF